MLMRQMSNGLGALNLVRAGDPPNPRVDEVSLRLTCQTKPEEKIVSSCPVITVVVSLFSLRLGAERSACFPPRSGQFGSPRLTLLPALVPHVLGQSHGGIARHLICVAPACVRVLRVGFGVPWGWGSEVLSLCFERFRQAEPWEKAGRS
jgi:hypothetical protein